MVLPALPNPPALTKGNELRLLELGGIALGYIGQTFRTGDLLVLNIPGQKVAPRPVPPPVAPALEVVGQAFAVRGLVDAAVRLAPITIPSLAYVSES